MMATRAATGAVLAAAVAILVSVPWLADPPASGSTAPAAPAFVGDSDFEDTSALQSPPRRTKTMVKVPMPALAQRTSDASGTEHDVAGRARALLENPQALAEFRSKFEDQPAHDEVQRMIKALSLLVDARQEEGSGDDVEGADSEAGSTRGLEEASDKPKSVAVIGCGIAGALTALELAHRGVQVTVIDREDDCGRGTSGRIAAVMEFFSMDKAAMLSSASQDSESILTDLMQGFVGASLKGMAGGLKYAARLALISGKTVKVNLTDYADGGMVFKSGPESPVLAATPPKTYGKLSIGHALVKVQGLSVYALSNMNKAADTNRQLQEFLVNAPKPIELTFLTGNDPRMNRVYQAEFFAQAEKRLKDFYLVNFPELCEAVISSSCCTPGTAARKWVEANFDKAGYRCPTGGEGSTDHGMGLAMVFTKPTNIVPSSAKQSPFPVEAWTQAQTDLKLANFLEGEKTAGAAHWVNSGFVRTELVFKVIKEILSERYKARYLFSRDVQQVVPSSGGVKVGHRKSPGAWNREPNGVLKFNLKPGAGAFDELAWDEFDRVVFSTGAAVGGALDKTDPSLHRQGYLIACYGYVAVGLAGKIKAEDKNIGVVFENHLQYARATHDGAVAMGGGMYFGDPDDETVRSLPWRKQNSDGGPGGGNTKLGAALMDDPKHTLMGGVRPMSVYTYMPLLRTYGGKRIILNTGASTNGFVVSWKAAEIAADLALDGKANDSRWDNAVTNL